MVTWGSANTLHERWKKTQMKGSKSWGNTDLTLGWQIRHSGNMPQDYRGVEQFFDQATRRPCAREAAGLQSIFQPRKGFLAVTCRTTSKSGLPLGEKTHAVVGGETTAENLTTETKHDE